MAVLVGGGVALDRVLAGAVTKNFDDQLDYVLTAMIASAEIGPDGEVFFNRPLGDQRFLEPNSGLYWQISGKGREDYTSRSLWDRSLAVRLDHFDSQPHVYDSDQFKGERLRIMERSIILPGSETHWWFVVAATSDPLVNEAVVHDAGRAGIWCNHAGAPDGGPAALPAVATDGPVTVAVSTIRSTHIGTFNRSSTVYVNVVRRPLWMTSWTSLV